MNFATAIWIRLRDRYAARFEPEVLRALTDLFWRTLLIIATCTILLSLLFGLWRLIDVHEMIASSADTSPLPPASLDRGELEQLTAGFDARAERFNNSKTSPPPIIQDPGR
jgi:hypothetical protein